MKVWSNVICLVLLIIFSKVEAKNYKFESYDQARNSHDYVMFESESTKLGFITTSYDGYAKDYDVNFKRDGDVLKDIEVRINTSSFDTDNSSRDEKMYESILEIKKFPHMIFKSNNKVILNEGVVEISGELRIKEVEKNIKLKLTVEKKGASFYIKGLAAISLKDFNVPDPSIAIASVRDRHELTFGISINE
ncbi:YceI family protein [Halobacteriovorax sp.]|uniref:YceI family protein n=1 Tax=Halobacteriovorax sp. TaxID=2020862 RepID=UPI00356AAF00